MDLSEEKAKKPHNSKSKSINTNYCIMPSTTSFAPSKTLATSEVTKPSTVQGLRTIQDLSLQNVWQIKSSSNGKSVKESQISSKPLSDILDEITCETHTTNDVPRAAPASPSGQVWHNKAISQYFENLIDLWEAYDILSLQDDESQEGERMEQAFRAWA
jgi:hypothetical protein